MDVLLVEDNDSIINGLQISFKENKYNLEYK